LTLKHLLGQALKYMDSVVFMTDDGRIARAGTSSEVELQSVSTPEDSMTPANSSERKGLRKATPVPIHQEIAEDKTRQNGDWTLYKHYILSIGWWRFALLVGVHLVLHAVESFPSEFSPKV
jgi:ATP-binding cassette, subfamily C (CFTR/MRP), member 1